MNSADVPVCERRSDETKDADNQLLQPGQSIRPRMNEVTASDLIRRLYGFEPIKVVELPSYDDRNYHVIVADSDRHGNPHVAEVCCHGYVLKVLNSLDSQKRHVEAQNELMRVLGGHNVCCPQPVLNVFGKDRSIELINDDDDEEQSDNESTSGGHLHVVRLLTYLPGDRLITTPYTPRLLYRFGEYLGNVDRSLENFSHPALDEHRTIWQLSNVVQLRKFTFAIRDESRRQLIHDVIDAFVTDVTPHEKTSRQGVTHGDYNEQNVIVRPIDCHGNEDVEFDIVGVIDFGDSNRSPYVYEVAIAMMYAMLDSHVVDPLSVGGHVFAGYLAGSGSVATGRTPLVGSADRRHLRTCIAARFAQSLTMGAYSFSLDPTNEYLLTTARRGWTILEALWRQTTEAELYARWNDVMKESHGMSFYDS